MLSSSLDLKRYSIGIVLGSCDPTFIVCPCRPVYSFGRGRKDTLVDLPTRPIVDSYRSPFDAWQTRGCFKRLTDNVLCLVPLGGLGCFEDFFRLSIAIFLSDVRVMEP